MVVTSWKFHSQNVRLMLIVVIGPKWWNRLPSELRTTEDLSLFKSKLKTYMFTGF